MGLIAYGKITKAHGLSGGLKLLPFSRLPENLNSITRIFIDSPGNHRPEPFTLKECRFEKGSAVIRLEGIDSIEEAEKLIGRDVYIEKSDLPELGEGEFYWFELIGLDVYTEDGRYAGKVESLIDRALQSVLVVKDGGKEELIPLSEPIIKEINLSESKIIISPVEGLLSGE
ncbi:MAG: 16S rRNA processing protein RimM [Candidatus Dadabacteria bacterium]|nr:MAG: 16S rRNA processing protein RimM [Candidatus Dadabacteria bacterium]